MDMRLVRVQEEDGTDEYCVLQGLRDPTVDSNDPKCCYAYERSGHTGSRGTLKLEGPMEQSKAEAALGEVFQKLTGAEMGSLAMGARTPGKFWLQHASQPDLKARWKYYVSDGVDGKVKGWYSYEAGASDEVEEVYAQHVANSIGGGGSLTRWVRSGHFTYKVDLAKMTQENTRTSKTRAIRRSFSYTLGDAPLAKGQLRKKPARAAKKTIKHALKAKRSAASSKVKKTKKAAKFGGTAKVSKATKVGSKAMVWRGFKEVTKSGKKKSDLMLNRKGKVVSKSKSAAGKKSSLKNIAKWVESFKEAKTELGLAGFVLCKKGSKLDRKSVV